MFRNIILAALMGLPTVAVYADESVDFNQDIRPILSNHCFQCHGSDEGTREADLRLDHRDDAVGVLNASDGETSSLIERITSHDSDVQMPPSSANKPLTTKQIDLLKRWIDQGAAYDQHWAFRPVVKPSVPEIDSSSAAWARNEVDAFVLRKLAEKKLPPAEKASRAVLIRRLYQDLLGLLPTIDEADAFINDASPTAYAKLVDRLLQSPHYGERWARHWLDQARYADSHGYTIDGSRVMWPYRDWVIQAINDDMPFDRFTIEQLAGDLLPNATKPQLVATAFHRNTMINQEGGVKADQFRHEALIDRVNTTGAVWLGLTVGCAQCHSHKFDPLSHEEYYQMYAFFNGAADANNTGKTVSVLEGEMLDWSPEREQQATELAELQQQLKSLTPDGSENAHLASGHWKWQSPELLSYDTRSGVELQKQKDGSLLASKTVAANERYEVTFAANNRSKGGDLPITAVRLRVLPDDRLPKKGPGLASNGNFVLTDIHLEVDGRIIPFVDAWCDHSQPGYPIANAIDGNPKTGWAINVDAAAKKRGVRMNAAHEAVLVLPTSTVTNSTNNGQQFKLVMSHDANSNYCVGRFAFDVSTTSRTAESPSEDQQKLVTLKARIAELRAFFPAGSKPVAQMVMQDRATIPPTYRLDRGDFLTPDKDLGPLRPGVPAALKTTANKATAAETKFANRLDLAHWLVDKNNPLTARVTVNRVWAKYFGRGLVETENDFGFQSTPPTHPELLDWLAAEFMERDWSMKELHRLIVTSATYRQSSHVTDEKLAADAGNYWLSRQSRFRVEAEIVRDQGLAASGLLTHRIGGPSVYPPQPAGIYAFTQNKKSWPTETGPNRYRRTMYTMFYRSAPYPLLSTFDAPDFSTVCTRRVRSNTPLQSLTVANDVVFLELAEGLARRVFEDSSELSDADRCEGLFRHCLTRSPDERELSVLMDFLSRERKRFEANSEEAAKVVTMKTSSDLNVVELATWTSVARVLLNTDEFVTRN